MEKEGTFFAFVGVLLLIRWRRALLAFEHEGRQNALGHKHVVVLLQQVLEVLLCHLRCLLIFFLLVLILIQARPLLFIAALLLLVVGLVGGGRSPIASTATLPIHLLLILAQLIFLASQSSIGNRAR